MVETFEPDRDGSALGQQSEAMSAPDVRAWFVREVLPLEASLMQFLQHNWRNQSDIADLRQDIYMRVYDAAQKQIPDRTKALVFTIARNLIITRVRDAHVVPIEAVSDLDAINIAIDMPGPEHNIIARDELRRLKAAIDRLPPRCREAFVLARIDCLTHRQIALRMGITEDTVSEHIAKAMQVLADILYAEPADLSKKA
jgi:RNA polymerase sigma factor (sigma-70 family)